MSGGSPSALQEPVVPQQWSAQQPAAAALVYVVAYLALTLGGNLLAGLRIPVWAAAALALMIILGGLTLSLLLVLSISRLRLHPGAEVAWIFGMMALFLFARPDAIAIAGRWLGDPLRGQKLAELLRITPEQQLFANIALILWAVFLGRLVSRAIREGKLLLPVAAVASIADIITVFYGVVAHLTKNAPEVVNTFSAQAPASPPPSVPLPALSSVGIGDFVFLALFLTVVARYAMNASKAMWFTLAMMLVAPTSFLFLPQLSSTGLPGLPFISVGVLGSNWRYLRFSPEEKRALAFAGVLVIAVAAWIVLRR